MTEETAKIITDHCEQCADSDCDEYLMALWCERLINATLGMAVPWQEIHAIVKDWWKTQIEQTPR